MDQNNKQPVNQKASPGKTLSNRELALFCYQLAVILKSGIPFTEGIGLLAETMEETGLKSIAISLADDIHQGMPLYRAISRRSEFPPYFVGMMEIAEQAGKLEEELTRLSDYYERSEALNQKLRSAITYPAVLAALMGGVILLLILKILPLFHEILLSLGGEMPGVTQALVRISLVIQDGFLWLLILVAVLLLVLVFALRTEKGQHRLDRLKLTAPLLKGIYGKLLAARFSRGLGILLASGMSFEDALERVEKVMENLYFSEKIQQLGKALALGQEMAEGLKEVAVLPGLFNKMMLIGYKTGQLEGMLDKLAVIYENETERELKRLSTLVEPTLVAILSIVVGAILFTVMLPLIQIISTIG